jgi:hypothetical protein
MHPTHPPITYLEHLSSPQPGMIVSYLLHLDPPYRHAGHYLGSTPDLERRLSEHGGLHGSPLLLAQKRAGGSWHLVRTWVGSRQKESELKSNNGKRYCPECSEHPRPGINTVPRQRKTRNQRRLQQETIAIQKPERIPLALDLWRAERVPVAVTEAEWLDELKLACQQVAQMAPESLAAVPPWHPAADFRPAAPNRSQVARTTGGYR